MPDIKFDMEKFNLEEIKRVIIEKYNWGSPAEWTNFHFKELSKSIEKTTGDRLSEETLKRIFGKRKVVTENYQPQAFSQMVLIRFVNSFEPSLSIKQIDKKPLGKRIKLAMFSVVGIIILLIVVVMSTKQKPSYSFSCKHATDYLPFTTSFTYNYSGIDDSVFCDFGKENEEGFLPPENSEINVFYKNAGIKHVHFYTRSRILDSLKVIVYSNDWQAGYFPNNKPEEFIAFHDQQFYRQADCFYAPVEKLKEEGADSKGNDWTAYKYFSPFNKSLDSLTMETRVLNNASTGSYLCYDIEIIMIGDSGLVDFTFTQLECSRFAKLQFSEEQMNGEFDDLNAMSVDLSDWLTIKVVTKNKNFNLYLADKLIFTGKYKKNMGNLLGVTYSFFGTGKIDYLKLKDNNRNLFYENEFSIARND